MTEKKRGTDKRDSIMKQLASGVRETLREPILKILLKNSVLTKAQLETLLVDLVVEDSYGDHVSYEKKASLRTRRGSKGVSRGAFNRTLSQARNNTVRCLSTMLLLAYLGLFDFAIFRPFEEVATKIGDYRRIRDVLAGKSELSDEEIESYRAVEETVLSTLEKLISPLALKSELSKRK